MLEVLIRLDDYVRHFAGGRQPRSTVALVELAERWRGFASTRFGFASKEVRRISVFAWSSTDRLVRIESQAVVVNFLLYGSEQHPEFLRTMTQTTIVTKDGTKTTLTEETLEVFRQRLRGPLLTPADPEFEVTTQLWNGMIEKTPALVVRPTGTADVVEAVNFARDNDLLLSVKCGGHNIAGTALADDGLTIDMAHLRGVIVDPDERIATAQAGCLLGNLDRETQIHGLATPGGFVSETGLAGLTLGGGFGYLTRRFGWTVDNLCEVEIVTADGQVRRVSREENEDLFWAIRGAGHNFGVVTSFTFQLHEVGPTVYGGLIAWPFERADETLETYQALTADAPRELTVFLNLRRAPPAPFVPEEWHGERICAMIVCYSGDLDATDEALASIRALEDPSWISLRSGPTRGCSRFSTRPSPWASTTT